MSLSEALDRWGEKDSSLDDDDGLRDLYLKVQAPFGERSKDRMIWSSSPTHPGTEGLEESFRLA